MLQLYGNPRSRAMRCMWMLEEMGAPYRLIEKSTRAEDLRLPNICASTPMHEFPPLWTAT